jgi:hypothetical protein
MRFLGRDKIKAIFFRGQSQWVVDKKGLKEGH